MARDAFPPVWLRERGAVCWQRTVAASQRVWRTAVPAGSRGLRVIQDTGKTTFERLHAISWQALVRRYSPLLVAVGVLLLLASPFALWKLPQWYAASWDKLTDPKDIAKLESDTRTAMVQALGGLALLTGLVFTWRNLRLTEQNSRHTLDLSRKGQINDRFIKAIEQLGAVDQGGGKKLEIRLGGIYALEQIAKDSPDDYHWPIMEILTAYVRENASWQEDIGRSEKQPTQSNPSVPTLTTDSLAIGETVIRWLPRNVHPTLTTDIQAILTVFGRRSRIYGKGEDQRLDLTGTDLRGARLQEAHLEGVDLQGAHLEGADLQHVHLEDADLTDAHLEDARLLEAHLERAVLWYAHLEGALLRQAYLKRAELCEAYLEGAALWEAHLEGALLMLAHLEGTSLWEAHLEGVSFSEAHLEGTDFEGAHLEGAALWGAHLQGAENLTIEQLATVKTLYEAHLDPPLLEQIRQHHPQLLEKPPDEQGNS